MQSLGSFGKLAFVAAIAAFGVQHLVYAAAGAGLGPPWIPGPPIWMAGMGLSLLAGSLSIAIPWHGRAAAILLGVLIFCYSLAIYVPRLAAQLHNPGPWTSGGELLALCGAMWVLAGTLPAGRPDWGSPGSGVVMLGTLGRFLFAALLGIVGIQHFLYAHFIATLVPAWIPARLFWAYFVGVAFFAASVSFASRKYLHFAGTLLGIMFLLWVFIVHTPRVIAAPRNANEWTSLFVALAMGGGAWILTATAAEGAGRNKAAGFGR
jgi:uncharacterized membrane protein